MRDEVSPGELSLLPRPVLTGRGLGEGLPLRAALSPHSHAPSTSLRAQRSNPESFRGKTLDCFVASLLAMTARDRAYTRGILTGRTSRACAASLIPALAAPKP